MGTRETREMELERLESQLLGKIIFFIGNWENHAPFQQKQVHLPKPPRSDALKGGLVLKTHEKASL